MNVKFDFKKYFLKKKEITEIWLLLFIYAIDLSIKKSFHRNS